jgi:hypothetical protein
MEGISKAQAHRILERIESGALAFSLMEDIARHYSERDEILAKALRLSKNELGIICSDLKGMLNGNKKE